MRIHRLLAAAATCAAGAALAQTPPVGTPSTPPTTGVQSTSSAYGQLDKDLDGMLTKQEAAANAQLTEHWRTLDVNRDGRLDASEYARFEAEASVTPGAPSGAEVVPEPPQGGPR